MKIKVILGLGAAILLLLVGMMGCSAVQAQTAAQPVNISLNSQTGIWVTGSGKIPVAPDIATLNLGVSAQMPNIAETQAQASAAMEKVMQALKDKGIEKADIQTTRFNVDQVTRWDDFKQQSNITGYRVSNMVSVKVRDLENVAAIIDAVVAAGGDNVRFSGINFSVEKPEKYYVEAREHAMQDAKANAEKLASLSGVTLGKVTYVTENQGSQPYYYNGINSGMREPLAINAMDTPISIGQTDIVVSVTVTYSIQ